MFYHLLVSLIVLSVLIVIHEFGHFIVAKRSGVKVEIFSLGFGPKLLAKKKNGTEYMLCAIPLGGYIKMAGDNLEEYKGKPWEYISKAPGVRARIVFAGPLLNYILAVLCFWLVFIIGFSVPTAKVGELLDNYPAKKAGVLVGDRIISVDGKKVETFEEMQKEIQERKGTTVSLSILRGNQNIKIEIPLKIENVQNVLGENIKLGFIGVRPADEVITKKYGIIESFILSGRRTLDLTSLTYKAIYRIIIRKMSFRDSVTGPVGIFDALAKATRLGLSAVLYIMGMLSVSLAVFNLLPLPVLDGGHIVLLGIEKIKGKHFSKKVEETINQVGFSLILLLAIFVFYNDLVKFGVFEKISNFIKLRL